MTGWPERESPPPLGANELHVWSGRLDALLGRAGQLGDSLAGDERDQAARFRFELDAGRYTVCRGLLRRLLAGYLDAEPAAIALEYGSHGKPRLAGSAELQFNVSHAGGFALIGVTRRAEIGVDLERNHPLPDLESVMRTSFAPSERSAIEALPTLDERHAAFFRCWTRKEAVLKALGWGLALPLDSFEVSVDGAEPPRLLSLRGQADASRAWRLVHLEPGPGYTGAAAWAGPELTVSCWSLAA